MNSEDPKILSDHERDNFSGPTIDEDGTVHDQQSLYEERLREQQNAQQQRIHIVTSGLSWRVKLAIGVVAVIIGALGLIVMAMPYLLGIFVIYCLYSILSSILHR